MREGDQNRTHSPIEVEIYAGPDPSDEWAKQNDVVAYIEGVADRGWVLGSFKYQAIYLTGKDLTNVLPQLTSCADSKTRIGLAIDILTGLGDAHFLDALGVIFAQRSERNRK